MRRVQTYSIFGQIDAIVAEEMASEGKVRRIERDMIPHSALCDNKGNVAWFAIVMDDTHLEEYNKRVADLRA